MDTVDVVQSRDDVGVSKTFPKVYQVAMESGEKSVVKGEMVCSLSHVGFTSGEESRVS